MVASTDKKKDGSFQNLMIVHVVSMTYRLDDGGNNDTIPENSNMQ